MVAATRHFPPLILYLLIVCSGFATLSWEVIWQIKSTLALGVSAWGAAITLAIIMGGMGLGGLLMGSVVRKRTAAPAVLLYGLLEIVVGSAGLFLNAALQTLEKLDAWAYIDKPSSTSLITIAGMIAIFGLPTLCMGATFPIFGLLSQQFHLSITKVYSVNTLGAAIGVLVVALLLIPLFGISQTIAIIAAINIMVGLSACLLLHKTRVLTNLSLSVESPTAPSLSWKVIFIVFATGFATFTLEIAWFRSFATLLPNTTDIFAIMLACMLIALGLAAKNASVLKQKKKKLGTQISLAGISILLVTPLIENLDRFFVYLKPAPVNASRLISLDWMMDTETFIANWPAMALYVYQIGIKFFLVYFIIVPPIRFLGTAFPWIIENQNSPHTIGKLYAVNTVAAIIGSISAAWFLLPTLGFAKTAWLAGAFVVIAGVIIIPDRKRYLWITLGGLALLIAMCLETGIGKTRVQGAFAIDEEGHPSKVLGSFEGPDATVSAVEYQDGTRALLINSALAAWESGQVNRASAHYMAWMGHLPMLLHPNPKKALVICFGTGQTSNAVRKENPEALDIVDINPNVFKLAHHFKSNENVLNDTRVKIIVMDGRAYMRRTQKVYDVITLEPMPPNAVGVNALYSKEFYELAHKRLSDNGIIAQWLPFHIVAPHYTASIAKTFMAVFPNAILWIDPDSKTGILIGKKDNNSRLATEWPGFARNTISRNLLQEEIKQYVMLDSNKLAQFSAYGEIINDDNQLLAYGKALYPSHLLEENFMLLHRINKQITFTDLGPSFR